MGISLDYSCSFAMSFSFHWTFEWFSYLNEQKILNQPIEISE
jgi:hypothetical protein